MNLGTLDYETFDYRTDDQALSLDEAIWQAQQMRQADRQHYYRVNPVDPAMTRFKVTRVAPADVYGNFAGAIIRRLLGNWRRP